MSACVSRRYRVARLRTRPTTTAPCTRARALDNIYLDAPGRVRVKRVYPTRDARRRPLRTISTSCRRPEILVRHGEGPTVETRKQVYGRASTRRKSKSADGRVRSGRVRLGRLRRTRLHAPCVRRNPYGIACTRETRPRRCVRE